jgi:hypothetical protein
VDTVPATDSAGKYTGTTQVTTTHRQQTGFALQDEWLNNVSQVSLPGIGAVNRTTYNDAGTGQVTAYTYWTSDSTGYHEYGLDSYVDGNNNPAGYLTYSIRYTAPGITVPANLMVGQTQRFTMQRAVTYYNSNGSVDSSSSYTQPYSETATLVDFEPVTVQAGTFQNAAKLQIDQQGSYTDSQNVTQTLTYSDTYWALPTLGTVQGQETITVNGVTSDGANADTAIYPYSYDTTYSLQYASISGTTYGTVPASNKSVIGHTTMAHPVFPDRRMAP